MAFALLLAVTLALGVFGTGIWTVVINTEEFRKGWEAAKRFDTGDPGPR